MAKNDDKRMEKLKRLKKGESIFVENATQETMAPLRRLAQRAGVAVSIYRVERDAIHQKPGCRLFRN